MAATTYSVAHDLFHWAYGDASRVADIRAAFDSAISGGALTKGGMDSISSAGKNGVTMSKVIGLDESSRQTALRIALAWLSQGFAPRTRSRGIF
tara:strand:- start:559 stop:840 length:282 start_codon:yes stop_codon:yes gene_type:complete